MKPGFYLATHDVFRPTVVEYCIVGKPHWRNQQDDRCDDPTAHGYRLLRISGINGALEYLKVCLRDDIDEQRPTSTAHHILTDLGIEVSF